VLGATRFYFDVALGYYEGSLIFHGKEICGSRYVSALTNARSASLGGFAQARGLVGARSAGRGQGSGERSEAPFRSGLGRESPMSSFALCRYAFSISAASALLAACGALPLNLSKGQGDMHPPMTSGVANVREAGKVAQQLSPTSSYQVLHRFSVEGPAASEHPDASLLDINGTLYGVTYGSQGDKLLCGTVFSMSTAGATKVLYRFDGPDGCRPLGTLIDVNGTLYGTTAGGGSSGLGTVYSISTSGAEKVLYSFKGAPDGAYPLGGLVDLNGTLYGTTNEGGYVLTNICNDGCGTVYSITTSGVESLVHSFNGTDGYNVTAPLIAVKGKLYGTADQGGGHGYGAVFSVTTAGIEKVLYGFTGGKDGNDPLEGPLISVDGMFYGTTVLGGSSGHGIVYRVTPSGSESVVYSFGGRSDGAFPRGLIYENGTFYGTTEKGGGYGSGTTYSLTPRGSEVVLHRFEGTPDGAAPNGPLIDLDGTFYGTSFAGGAKGCSGRGCGTAFAITH
jgi:uncharacterized repeat protein (TIGR03803 family)